LGARWKEEDDDDDDVKHSSTRRIGNYYSTTSVIAGDLVMAAARADNGDNNSSNNKAEKAQSQQVDETEELRKELTAAKEAAEGNLSKLRYLMADFDNYRKQMEKHVTSRVESIKAELLLKFLNIRDDYERAIESARQKKSEPAVIQGLEGILKNIDSLLSAEGVKPIEAVGTPFDPNVHDAIAFSAKGDDVPENTVTAEIRRGYVLNGKVLRPSMVEIARKIVKNSDSAANNGSAGVE
jgi:molecular chaperone GrpE